MAETHLPAVIDTFEPYAPAPPAPDAEAGRREWGQHPINIRMSLPLLFGRYYVTLGSDAKLSKYCSTIGD